MICIGFVLMRMHDVGFSIVFAAQSQLLSAVVLFAAVQIRHQTQNGIRFVEKLLAASMPWIGGCCIEMALLLV
jgi:hypothetical protein